jgi:ubiquinone/menaquinone biosynthesis C-methylase UbiE
MSAPTTDSPASNWERGDYRRIAQEHQIVSERLCEEAAITSGHQVLDVACGTGNTALAARRRRAEVTGVDIASGLLERAETRAQAEGLEGIKWVTATAEDLPFADGAFDATLSTYGAVFAANQTATAHELLRVTRPGGIIALASHTPTGFPAEVYRLANRVQGLPDAERPAFAWARGAVAHELLDAGSARLWMVPAGYTCCFPSARAYLEHYEAYYGPIAARLAAMEPAQADDYRSGLLALLERFNHATDGTLMVHFDYMQIMAVRGGR